MMKRAAAVGAAALAMLLLAALAVGAVRSEHRFSMTYSAKTPKTSTGIKFATDRFGYVAPVAGARANPVEKIVFVTAPGTKISPTAVPVCSRATLEKGAAACPKGSSVGRGEATVLTGNAIIDGAGGIKEDVEIFATRGGLLAYLTGAQTGVIPLKVSGNRITAVVPRVCLPGGTPADDCKTGEAVLTKLTATIRARGKGSRLLARTPVTCKGGKWTNTATYYFRSGDTERKTSTTPCKR